MLEFIALKYVVDVEVCNNVPPAAALYHLNVGVGAPLVETTVAAGIPYPHCDEPADVGAEGKGITVTLTVAVVLQPETGVVAVTV